MDYDQSTQVDIESTSRYIHQIDRRINDLSSTGNISIESLLSETKGAFPTLVLNRCIKLGIGIQNTCHQNEFATFRTFTPELHPLDFEWYFTEESAEHLAKLLCFRNHSLLCLGAPTVATANAKLTKNTFLVDRNRLNIHRFTGKLKNVNCIYKDVLSYSEINKPFSVIFFDAPWYKETIISWLLRAAQLIRNKGIIAFSLFQELTRPSAKDDREMILEVSSRIGNIEIARNALHYETPLFERQALIASDTFINFNWRKGDLVLIHVNNTPIQISHRFLSPQDQWDSYTIRGQVIKHRKFADQKKEHIFTPIDNCHNYIFPSVSHRDKRRPHINIWTSRNKVATVSHHNIVASILGKLEKYPYNSNFDSNTIIKHLDLEKEKRWIIPLLKVLDF
ncbi:MAG: hypothetical protein V3W18_13475 [candidate division Zixibacteria bacterium]